MDEKVSAKMCCSCFPLWDGAFAPQRAHKFPRERLSQGGRWQLTSARPSPILPSNLPTHTSYASTLTSIALSSCSHVVTRLAIKATNFTTQYANDTRIPEHRMTERDTTYQ